jgi:hypothetical protein
MAFTTEKIDIASCIANLLYLHDTVILPGLGAFEGAYTAASIDAVQGVVHPPSKKLRFNPHLRIDDGLLVHEIVSQYQYSNEQARAEVEAYASRLRQSLDKREIVEIAGVGRLYIDFEGGYKFLPAPQNFNAGAFGLPDVRFDPVKRKPATVPVAQQEAPKAAPAVRKPIDLKQYAPYAWIIALAAVILSVSLFFIIRQIRSYPESGVMMELPPAAPTTPAGDMEDDEPEVDEDNAFVTGSLGELVDTEAPTRPPGVKEAVAIIGTFGEDANAEKQIQALFIDGYEAYTDKQGGATRVGVRLAYETEAELDTQLKVIQSRYNKKAWLFFPNAE